MAITLNGTTGITTPALDSSGPLTSLGIDDNATSTAITIDASNNVGIGTSSPNAVTNYTGLTLNNGYYGGFIDIENNGTHTFRLLSNTTATYIKTIEADPLVFSTADTERMRIGSTGAVTMPYQPAFCATPSSVQTNLPATDSATTVAMGTEIFDVGGNFASSTFTAPVTGKYQLNLSIYLTDVDAAAGYIMIGIITSNRYYINNVAPKYASDPAYLTQNISTLADMDAGDTAYVFYRQSGGAAQTDIQDDARASFFQGYLVA
jgi:hypothetical protein